MYVSKLERKVQKIFAYNCDPSQMCAFGTPNPQVSKSPMFTKDVDEIQTPTWEGGWFPETLSGNIRPYAEDMNALHYALSYQIAYLMQAGIPEWNKDTPYFVDSIVRVNGRLYIALEDNSDVTPVDNEGTWKEFTTGADDYMPVGASLEWNSNIPPSDKWMFEQGQAISRSTYSLLFSRIGTTFGGGDGSTTFNLPNSVGRFTVGFQSGNDPRGTLGRIGGQWDMTFTVPPHKHGIGNMRIVESGGHTHVVNDNGHFHGLQLPDLSHQHTFRFGDYSAAAPFTGSGVVRRLVTLGSTGSGSDANPTQVGWDAGTPNGAHTGHFRKMVSQPTPNGSMEPYSSFPPNRNLNTASVRSNLTLVSATHTHDSSSFVGSFGAAGSTNNGDAGFITTSNNPPYIVKRKIIRVLP